MCRYLADPVFMMVYRAARRDVFYEALAVFEKNSRRAAQALVDSIEASNPSIARSVASRVIDNAFKAQDAILIEEELTRLRETLALLKENPTAAAGPPAASAPAMESNMSEAEQADARRLRVARMLELGHSFEEFDRSLRYNRPTSAAQEQDLLDLVRKQLEWERTYEEAMRTCT